MMKETSPHVRMKSLEAFVSLARQLYLIACIMEAWAVVIK